MTDTADLVERLREDARQQSAASKMLADAKSARQTDRDDHPEMGQRGYAYVLPEQTNAWKAATLLESLSSSVAEVERLRALSDAATPGPWLVHTEWEVNYPPTIHAPSGGLHGPIEPLSGIDQEFTVAAVNYVRAALAQVRGD